MPSGGDLITEALRRQGVTFFFALCGGHISPILVSAQRGGSRVIDVRHEATAVFAADATARLTGTPGVAAVTAGPGATNTITAVKNAQMAQSPVVLLGGATATLLKGRGSLQDIDQLSAIRPHVKWAYTCHTVGQIIPALEQAFEIAKEPMPGPVFLELPVDLLYPVPVGRQWYAVKPADQVKGWKEWFLNRYLARHLDKLFRDADTSQPGRPRQYHPAEFVPARLERVSRLLTEASRP